MKEVSVREDWRESHVGGKSSRVDYLIDLILNYFPSLDDLCQYYHDVIIVVYADKNAPMTEEEDNKLYKAIGLILAKSGIKSHLFCGHDDDVQGEIALRIIGISDLKQDEDE